jgi:hypothetical protein
MLARFHEYATAAGRVDGTNLSVSEREVRAVLDRLRNNKAAGTDRLPAECLKYAKRPPPDAPDRDAPLPPDPLAQALAAFFTSLLRTGTYPESWRTALLTPLHKGKGLDPTDPANYRGIAVISSVAKVYSCVLQRRLSSHLEAPLPLPHAPTPLPLRDPCQSGFRKGLGPAQSLFALHTLQTLHTNNCSTTPPLFACFVDFSKAFDKVRHEALWARLATLGIRGELLGGIKSMYSSMRMRVRVSGRLGAAFESLLGVKQGDPLSPDLFGAFIEVLPEFMQCWSAATHTHGFLDHTPTMRGFVLFYLLFADDLTLLATSPAALQRMLDALHEYCRQFDMEVNAMKTQVVVFGRPAQRRHPYPPFTYAGSSLELIDVCKFLGMRFSGNGSSSVMLETACAAANRARFAVQRKISSLKCLPPETQLRMFKSLVLPVLTYGCQVWGASLLTLPPPQPAPPSPPRYDFVPTSARAAPIEAVQIQFARFVTGTGRTAPTWCLLHECSLDSVSTHIAGCVLRFWMTLRSPRSRGHVSQHAAKADIDLMLHPGRHYMHTCWSYKVCLFLAELGRYTASPVIDAAHSAPFFPPHPPFPTDSADYFWGLSFDPSLVIATLRGFWHERLVTLATGNPRTCPTLPKYTAYVSWMGLRGDAKWFPHMSAFIPRREHACYMQLRLGCWHDLAVNMARRRQAPYLPRSARHCRHCAQRCVEDEQHVLLECPHYSSIRSDFPSLLLHSTTLLALFAHPDQPSVARLAYRIRCARHPNPEPTS